MKYDVFISYSRKDSAIVKRFADELGKAGYTYWMDIDGVESGDEFKKKIAAAIKDSNVFIYFSSVSSNDSEWTIKEVNYAIKKKIHIIPIKLDNADYNESVDFDLCAVDFIQCTNSGDFQKAIEKLLRALRNKVGAREKGDGADSPKDSNHFWDFFANSTFNARFSYLLLLFLIVSVGVGAWSSFIVQTSKQPDTGCEQYVKDSLMAEFERKEKARIAEQHRLEKERLAKEAAERERLEKILSTPRCSKGLLCLAAVNKNSHEIAYFTADEWNSLPQNVKTNYAQLGVSISEDGHEFIIAPTDCKDPDDGDYKLQFGCYGMEFDRVIQYKEISEFIATGYNDTKNIVEQAKGKIDSKGLSGAPAAEAAWNYKANEYDNLQWYLPSVSELEMIYRNKDAINNIIRDYIPQGQQMMEFWYWSSTVCNYRISWLVNLNHGYSFYITGFNRNSSHRVRAVALAK